MGHPTTELNGEELTIEIDTGNKQWVAQINGTDDAYGLDRDFISPYGQGTETVAVSDGDVIEVAWDSHGGRAKGRDYYQVRDGELELLVENHGAAAHGDTETSPVEEAL